MQITYDDVIAQPLDVVWQSLTDIDGVLAALPWVPLAQEGAPVSGSLKCKVGSTQITYRVTATAEIGDPAFHTARITVTGQEARGSGTIDATLTVALEAAGADTNIAVSGDVTATGRGESAAEAAWQRVLKALVNAILPPPATPAAAPATPTPAPATPTPAPATPTPAPATPAPAPATPAPPAAPRRPALVIAPEPGPVAGSGLEIPTWLGVAGVAIGVIFIARRRRSRRRHASA